MGVALCSTYDAAASTSNRRTSVKRKGVGSGSSNLVELVSTPPSTAPSSIGQRSGGEANDAEKDEQDVGGVLPQQVPSAVVMLAILHDGAPLFECMPQASVDTSAGDRLPLAGNSFNEGSHHNSHHPHSACNPLHSHSHHSTSTVLMLPACPSLKDPSLYHHDNPSAVSVSTLRCNTSFGQSLVERLGNESVS